VGHASSIVWVAHRYARILRVGRTYHLSGGAGDGGGSVLILKRRGFLAVTTATTCLILAVGFLAGRTVERYVPVTESILVLSRRIMPLFYVKTEEPVLTLTFDISWGHETAPRVLEILREKNVRATFFLSGPWAKRHAGLVEEIGKAGHDIGSHGDAHVDLSRYPRDVVEENIRTAHEDLLNTAGRVSPFFRPPNGDYDDVVVETAKACGYETVIWAVDSLDWKNPGADYMVDRVPKLAFKGAIILMHASDSSKQIHEALPRIIDSLRAKGYKLVPLSELLTYGEPGRNDPR